MNANRQRTKVLFFILSCISLLIVGFPSQANAAETTVANPKFIQISGQRSEHVLLLKSDGTVWGFGENSKGQLGDGTTTFRSTLVQVKGLPKIKEVLASGRLSAAIAENGDLYTWGSNQDGLAGQGETIKFLTVPTFLLAGVKTVTTPNGEDALALKTDGSIWGWGWDAGGPNNPNGLWGNGRMHAYIPVEYTPNHQFVSLVKDYLKAPDGKVVQYLAWAGGYQQQPMLTNKRVVNASWTYVLLSDGIVYKRPTQTTFERFSSLSFTKLKGENPWGALDIAGNLWMWGMNGFGQLGNGRVEQLSSSNKAERVNPNEKVMYKTLTNVADFAIGASATYALRTDGTIWGWGVFPSETQTENPNRQLVPKWVFNANGELYKK